MQETIITPAEDLGQAIYRTILENKVVAGKEILSGKISEYQGRVIFSNIKDLTYAVLRINKKTILATFNPKTDEFIVYSNITLGIERTADIDPYINDPLTIKRSGFKLTYSEFILDLLDAIV